MDETQGVNAGQPSAIPVGGQGVNTAPSDAVIDQQFLAPSTDTSAIPEGQGVNQGAPQQSEADRYRAIQGERDRMQAENYRLQEQFAQTQQQYNELALRLVPQQQPNTNPYDPQSQTEQYWDWKLDSKNKQLLAEAERMYENKFMGMVQQASEQSWAQQHPNVDVRNIKAQIKQRYGIDNPPLQMLDDYHRIMTEPTRLQTVAQNAGQQALQNFRQPQTGATPIKPNGGMPVGQPTYKYEDLVAAVNQRGEGVLNSLPKADQDEFWRVTHELNQRIRSGAPIY